MKLLILDGNSIVNRAFYGIRPLTAPDGTPTNAVYGFVSILQKLINEESPEGLCVAFDLPGPTFRHEMYDGYKAKRKGMPDELAVQMPILKSVLDAMGIRRYELPGYEADDILGAISATCDAGKDECVIVTGDKDSLQLITVDTRVKHVKSRMGQTETIDYDILRFQEEYGFPPIRLIDLKALMGDASDNIPGVPGVGEKTAMDLIRRYGDIDSIYSGLDELDIKEGVRKKLREGEDLAHLSRELAAIRTEIPLEFSVTDTSWRGEYGQELYDIFKRLGFARFIKDMCLEPGEDCEAQETPSLPEIQVTGGEELDSMLEAIKSAGHVAVAVEKGLDELELCDGKSVYILRREDLFIDYDRALSGIFSPERGKIAHGVKDLMGVLMRENLPVDGFSFDTELAAYLLEPTDSRYDLERLSSIYLQRSEEGAAAIHALYPVLLEKLEGQDMESLYFDMELPLSRTLADMEREGFLIDREALHSFGESLDAGINALESRIYELAGEEFNINSPKQLGVILFDKLMLPHGRKTKTGWSTNADVLEKLRFKHPVIEDILEYRKLTKLKSTYTDGLLKVISPDGRIHTNFQMTVTATGRLSSVEPNLQNIPIRTQLGGEIRRMFVPAPGKVLVDADYSQIELRLLAHISNDDTMKNAFLTGEDIHAVTASQVFDIPLNEVTPLHRSRAKAVNFGIVYGIGSFSLSQDINVSVAEAKEYMDNYLAKYHGVRDYMKSIVEKANEDGYVETLFKRRRPLPELKSSNFNLRSFGERVALNMPIQGTAADIMKIAMIRVHRRFLEEGLEARLILQVHDELIAECPQAEAEKVKEILITEMEGAAQLSVPLTADVQTGKNWLEAK